MVNDFFLLPNYLNVKDMNRRLPEIGLYIPKLTILFDTGRTDETGITGGAVHKCNHVEHMLKTKTK